MRTDRNDFIIIVGDRETVARGTAYCSLAGGAGAVTGAATSVIGWLLLEA
jgi:hypothetical protein